MPTPSITFDISAERDGIVYICKPMSPLGKLWCIKHHDVSLQSFFIPESIFDEYKIHVNKHGLTIEIDD